MKSRLEKAQDVDAQIKALEKRVSELEKSKSSKSTVSLPNK